MNQSEMTEVTTALVSKPANFKGKYVGVTVAEMLCPMRRHLCPMRRNRNEVHGSTRKKAFEMT